MDTEQEKVKLEELIGRTDRKFLHWWDENPTATLVITWFTGWLTIVLLPLSIYTIWWYLGRKNRSRWFLLLAFVPVGMWVIILMQDKSWNEVP